MSDSNFQAPPSVDNAVYIATDEELKLLCESMANAEYLALDTEFIRTDTFFPIAGLIQLSSGGDNYLLDPLSIKQWQPLIKLMTDENIPKVLHSCSEDLEVFDRLLGVLPAPIFDTQIAAAMLGLGFSLSYQKLVDAILSQHVEKGETRSNWLQRPLTSSQCHYAALDVEYLPQVYRFLKASLEKKARLNWLQQDCETLLDNFKSSNSYYTKVKSAWKLSSQQLHVLDKLTQWREQQARSRDVPRGRILKDKSCFEIASKLITESQQLTKVSEMSHKTLRKEGDIIANIVVSAKGDDASVYPPRLPKPLPVQLGSTLKQLKAAVSAVADQLNVAQEILVRKKDYELLVRSGYAGGAYQLPKSLLGWRKSVVGDQLLKQLQE